MEMVDDEDIIKVDEKCQDFDSDIKKENRKRLELSQNWPNLNLLTIPTTMNIDRKQPDTIPPLMALVWKGKIKINWFQQIGCTGGWT